MEPETTPAGCGYTAAGVDPITVVEAASTAGELVECLAALPPDMPVLVDGYEGGYSRIGAVRVREVHEMGNRGDWLGSFARADQARREVEDPLPMHPVPYLVGEPLHAVILHRERHSGGAF